MLKTDNMIRDIDKGRIMVVTDLHGDGYDYRQIMKVYNAHKQNNEVDFLVFTGDLIHSYPGKKDESVAIVEDLISHGANERDSDIICLLGNHEFVHIYHIPLVKGHLEFTSFFERRIKSRRTHFIDFFQKMPLALRTIGGVLINHTGAAIGYLDRSHCLDLEGFKELSHTRVMNEILSAHSGLNPFGIYDRRVGDAFMQTDMGKWMWEILMNGNELQYGDDYFTLIGPFLEFMSADRVDNPINVMVTGHIGVEWGAEKVGDHQLRLCSSAGCGRDLEKKYLLFEADKCFANAEKLMEYTKELY